MENNVSTPEVQAPKKISEAIVPKESKAKDSNENTAKTPEKIEKAAADGIVSFDELEAIDGKRTREKLLEKRTKKKEVAAKGDVGSEKPAEKADSASAKSTETGAKEGEHAGKALEKPVKTFKLKNGESEIEIRSDLKVPIKVDGQDVEVDFQELMNDYSGKQAISKRFTEYNQLKQKFDKQKQDVDSFIQKVFEVSKENPLEGLMVAAEHAGLDPIQYQLNLIDSLTQFSQQWAQMSDVERENYKLQMENSRFKKQTEQFKTVQESEKAQKALDMEVQSIESELGVSRQQFADAYFQLEGAAKQGLIKGEISPSLVKEFILDTRLNETAKALLAGVHESVANRENIATMVEVMYKYPEFSLDELKEIAQESFGKRSHMVVSEKIAKAKPDLMEAKTAINPEKQDLWSFDQLK